MILADSGANNVKRQHAYSFRVKDNRYQDLSRMVTTLLTKGFNGWLVIQTLACTDYFGRSIACYIDPSLNRP